MSDLNDRAAEEWESLRLMSFHGAPWSSDVMLADLTQEDVAGITDLINDLAAANRAAEARVAALTQGNAELRALLAEWRRDGFKQIRAMETNLLGRTDAALDGLVGLHEQEQK